MFDRCGDLAAVDDDTLSELLREASAEVNRAQVRRLAIAAEWDRRQAWANDGAYNGRCWLTANCGLSRREASSVLHTAEVVASAPVVAAAVQEGVVPVAKAEVLAAVVTVRTAQAFVRDQELLVEAVGRLGVDETRKLARWWQRTADVDGAEPGERPLGLRWSVAGDGTTHLTGVLGVEGGAIVRSMLEAISDQLWRAEREPGQVEARPVNRNERLRAEALVEMARRVGAADPGRTGARPLLTVVVDLDTLEGRAGRPAEVDGGGLVTAEAARRLACDADVSRLLVGPDGAMLELGRTTRTASADQWRALRIRDGGCSWPGCERPPGWCQAHHIVWWQDGGATDLENLTLLCSHHHHRVHDGGWRVERLDDRSLQFTDPGGRTVSRPPPPPSIPLRCRPRVSPLDRAAILQRVRALTAA